MKTKVIALLVLGALVLPVVSSLFHLEARRRANFVVIQVVSVSQSTISPN